MEIYKAVRSGLDISRSVADYWEQTAPNTTNEQRAKRIRAGVPHLPNDKKSLKSSLEQLTFSNRNVILYKFNTNK